MIWFYESNSQFRRCELYPTDRTHYRLVIQDVDGVEKVETYDDYADLVRRTEQLAQEWTRAGWSGPFSRR